jgi:hypothetical protein
MADFGWVIGVCTFNRCFRARLQLPGGFPTIPPAGVGNFVNLIAED